MLKLIQIPWELMKSKGWYTVQLTLHDDQRKNCVQKGGYSYGLKTVEKIQGGLFKLVFALGWEPHLM